MIYYNKELCVDNTEFTSDKQIDQVTNSFS